MAVWTEDDGTTIYLCDVCRAERVDRFKGSWDEARLASVRAREAGWRLKKRRGGQWEALCPECAEFDGYSLSRESLP